MSLSSSRSKLFSRAARVVRSNAPAACLKASTSASAPLVPAASRAYMTVPAMAIPVFSSSLASLRDSGFVDVSSSTFRSHHTGSDGSNEGPKSQNSWFNSRLMHLALQVLTGAITLAAFNEMTGVEWSLTPVSHACGIVAFTSNDVAAVAYLLEGLHILQNRGYDSAGIATISPETNEVLVTKYASVSSTSDSIELLKANAPERHKGHTCGIAHTRWATHGGRTDANAHPFADYKGRLALVHNGTIENCTELRKELLAKGVTFKSQTDSEVIANLISVNIDTGLNMQQAVEATLKRLEGTWGLVIIDKEHPSTLIAARNGSPLVVGIGNEGMFVASEVTAFMRHTSQFIPLADGELAIVGVDSTSLSLSRVQQAHTEIIEQSPDPYPHWTIKEIYEQPSAVLRTLGFGSRFTHDGQVKLGGLERNLDALIQIEDLVIAACGTSLFASNYGARLMRSLGSFATVLVEDAAEVTADVFPASYRGGVCVVSQSGETKDTHRALVAGMDLDLPAFSIVNQVGSLIARTTNCGVYLNAGREHAVASTKAFTTQVAALAMIAAWFSQQKHRAAVRARSATTPVPSKGAVPASSPTAASAAANTAAANAAAAAADAAAAAAAANTPSLPKQREVINALHKLPVCMGMALKTHDQMKALAQKLKEAQHMFILGKGLAEPIAKEAALKIKEITYIHAEGFSGGALKHGPFALLEEGTPVVLFLFSDMHFELMRVAAQEVKARGTYNIIVTDRPEAVSSEIANEVITVPNNGPMTALIGVIPLQLLAYEIAVAKGINPDKPKNLAKAVTVD